MFHANNNAGREIFYAVINGEEKRQGKLFEFSYHSHTSTFLVHHIFYTFSETIIKFEKSIFDIKKNFSHLLFPTFHYDKRVMGFAKIQREKENFLMNRIFQIEILQQHNDGKFL